MRSRALPLALTLSGVLHAAVIAVSHNAAPTLTPDPALVYSTQLEAVLIDAAQDKGETLLPSEAAAESAAADPTDPLSLRALASPETGQGVNLIHRVGPWH